MDIVISQLNLNNFIKKDTGGGTCKSARIYKSFGEINESTMSKPKDPRLKSEQFRQKVRRVFAHLGIDNSQGNFNQWNGLLNWDKIDQSIDHPTRLAIHHTRGVGGDIIEIQAVPVVGCREIAACSESQASKILAKESKVFVKWWEITRFDCGEAVMEELRKEYANDKKTT